MCTNQNWWMLLIYSQVLQILMIMTYNWKHLQRMQMKKLKEPFPRMRWSLRCGDKFPNNPCSNWQKRLCFQRAKIRIERKHQTVSIGISDKNNGSVQTSLRRNSNLTLNILCLLTHHKFFQVYFLWHHHNHRMHNKINSKIRVESIRGLFQESKKVGQPKKSFSGMRSGPVLLLI